jgi:hypothetical protein
MGKLKELATFLVPGCVSAVMSTDVDAPRITPSTDDAVLLVDVASLLVASSRNLTIADVCTSYGIQPAAGNELVLLCDGGDGVRPWCKDADDAHQELRAARAALDAVDEEEIKHDEDSDVPMPSASSRKVSWGSRMGALRDSAPTTTPYALRVFVPVRGDVAWYVRAAGEEEWRKEFVNDGDQCLYEGEVRLLATAARVPRTTPLAIYCGDFDVVVLALYHLWERVISSKADARVSVVTYSSAKRAHTSHCYDVGAAVRALAVDRGLGKVDVLTLATMQRNDFGVDFPLFAGGITRAAYVAVVPFLPPFGSGGGADDVDAASFVLRLTHATLLLIALHRASYAVKPAKGNAPYVAMGYAGKGLSSAAEVAAWNEGTSRAPFLPATGNLVRGNADLPPCDLWAYARTVAQSASANDVLSLSTASCCALPDDMVYVVTRCAAMYAYWSRFHVSASYRATLADVWPAIELLQCLPATCPTHGAAVRADSEMCMTQRADALRSLDVDGVSPLPANSDVARRVAKDAARRAKISAHYTDTYRFALVGQHVLTLSAAVLAKGAPAATASGVLQRTSAAFGRALAQVGDVGVVARHVQWIDREAWAGDIPIVNEGDDDDEEVACRASEWILAKRKREDQESASACAYWHARIRSYIS